MTQTITGHTVLTGLLGSPVSHSISPMMHNEAFRLLGLDYAYLAFDVNTEELPAAAEGLRALKVRGFNLTMPDKNRMCGLCDRLSPVAQITGAVNTVVNDNGIFTGHTTDGTGFLRSAREAGWEKSSGKMTLLGAGGAAAAIVAQAAFDGVPEISVFNRRSASFTRMKQMAEELSVRTSCRIHLYDYSLPDVLRNEIRDSTLLVNATSAGMAPDTEKTLIPDASFFHKDLIVSDIIYNPRQTKLLRMAAGSGCRTFNGLSMLLYQGAESFRLWTGQDMPVEVIREKYFR